MKNLGVMRKLPFWSYLLLLAVLQMGLKLTWGDEESATIRNNCKEPVWLGMNYDRWYEKDKDLTGFKMEAGQSKLFKFNHSHIMLWGRTKCNAKGGQCETGNCPSDATSCGGKEGKKPFTFITYEFNCDHCYYEPQQSLLSSSSQSHGRKPHNIGQDDDPPYVEYAVHLTDGFNLPMSITRSGKKCGKVMGCNHPSILKDCPKKFQAKNKWGKVIGCNNLGGNRTQPNPEYEKFVKKLCPLANLYQHNVYDGKFKTCTIGTETDYSDTYTITFC